MLIGASTWGSCCCCCMGGAWNGWLGGPVCAGNGALGGPVRGIMLLHRRLRHLVRSRRRTGLALVLALIGTGPVRRHRPGGWIRHGLLRVGPRRRAMDPVGRRRRHRGRRGLSKPRRVALDADEQGQSRWPRARQGARRPPGGPFPPGRRPRAPLLCPSRRPRRAGGRLPDPSDGSHATPSTRSSRRKPRPPYDSPPRPRIVTGRIYRMGAPTMHRGFWTRDLRLTSTGRSCRSTCRRAAGPSPSSWTSTRRRARSSTSAARARAAGAAGRAARGGAT